MGFLVMGLRLRRLKKYSQTTNDFMGLVHDYDQLLCFTDW